MYKEYFSEYCKIVKGESFPIYTSPEEQGRAIKKCTILEPTDLSYGKNISIIQEQNKSADY